MKKLGSGSHFFLLRKRGAVWWPDFQGRKPPCPNLAPRERHCHPGSTSCLFQDVLLCDSRKIPRVWNQRWPNRNTNSSKMCSLPRGISLPMSSSLCQGVPAVCRLWSVLFLSLGSRTHSAPSGSSLGLGTTASFCASCPWFWLLPALIHLVWSLNPNLGFLWSEFKCYVHLLLTVWPEEFSSPPCSLLYSPAKWGYQNLYIWALKVF